jgi:hypothetical protein
VVPLVHGVVSDIGACARPRRSRGALTDPPRARC